MSLAEKNEDLYTKRGKKVVLERDRIRRIPGNAVNTERRHKMLPRYGHLPVGASNKNGLHAAGEKEIKSTNKVKWAHH